MKKLNQNFILIYKLSFEAVLSANNMCLSYTSVISIDSANSTLKSMFFLADLKLGHDYPPLSFDVGQLHPGLSRLVIYAWGFVMMCQSFVQARNVKYKNVTEQTMQNGCVKSLRHTGFLYVYYALKTCGGFVLQVTHMYTHNPRQRFGGILTPSSHLRQLVFGSGRMDLIFNKCRTSDYAALGRFPIG